MITEQLLKKQLKVPLLFLIPFGINAMRFMLILDQIRVFFKHLFKITHSFLIIKHLFILIKKNCFSYFISKII